MRPLTLGLLLIGYLATVPATATAGSVYRCTRADGSVEYSNVATKGCAQIFSYAPKGWTLVATGNGFRAYLSDRAAPPAAPGGWVLWDYDTPRNLGNLSYQSSVTRYQVRCNEAKAMITSTTWFSSGTMNGSSRQSMLPHDVDPIPGSIDDQLISAMCKRMQPAKQHAEP